MWSSAPRRCGQDYQGTSKASHIKDKLNEMMHLTETLYACAIAAACMGSATPSGAYFVDRLMGERVQAQRYEDDL